MRLALYQPDIPQNTGTILRMAACLGVSVDIIGPTGFDMSDRALRRAGLDYLEHVDLTRHASWDEFAAVLQGRAGRSGEADGRLVLLTSHGATAYTDFPFQPNDVVLLGRESAGVPEKVHAHAAVRLCIPMQGGLRSLNIAVAAAMVTGEALRQLKQAPA